MTDFTHFVGIDWTGAKGHLHGGLAVAICAAGQGAPRLVAPPSGRRRWGRAECQAWIAGGIGLGAGARALVGFDSSFGMPFMDERAYLAAKGLPDHIHQLWQHVDDLCAGADDLYGAPFVDQYAAHYLRPGRRGTLYSRRMRVAEQLAVDSGVGPCESVFHLIGPSQVGMAGLSTMRLLAGLRDHGAIAIWPFDEPAGEPVVLVEIYAAAFAALGGHRGKIRDRGVLKSILSALGATGPLRLNGMPDDHQADALVTAAALRHIHGDRKYWNPPKLSTMVRRTEGWIFGIL